MRLPLPRVRFTVRRMMIAVAAVGLMLGAYMACLARAERFKGRQEWHFDHASKILQDTPREMDETAWRRLKVRFGWNADMYHKYERAARYPFLPVAPDPPEPE